jgi:hypothetical protein
LRESEAGRSQADGLQFVPAVVDAGSPPVPERKGPRYEAKATGTIEIEISGVTVRVGRGADEDFDSGAACAESSARDRPDGRCPGYARRRCLAAGAAQASRRLRDRLGLQRPAPRRQRTRRAAVDPIGLPRARADGIRAKRVSKTRRVLKQGRRMRRPQPLGTGYKATAAADGMLNVKLLFPNLALEYLLRGGASCSMNLQMPGDTRLRR